MADSTMRNGVIALGLGGGIALAGFIASAQVPGLDIAGNALMMGLVVGLGTFAGLGARARNRPQAAASDQERAAMLAFPRRPGIGYIVVLRRERSARRAGFDLTIDGHPLARLMVSQFVVLPVVAGMHGLAADIPGAPGASAAPGWRGSIAAGDILLLETRTKMGLTRTSVYLEQLADSPQLRAQLAQMPMVMAAGQ